MRHAYKRKKLELRFDRTENRKGSGAWTAAMFHPTNSNIGPLQDHNASSPRVSNSRSSLDRVCPGMNKVEPCVHTRRFSSDLGHVFLLCPVIGSCTSHNASTLYSLQLSPIFLLHLFSWQQEWPLPRWIVVSLGENRRISWYLEF